MLLLFCKFRHLFSAFVSLLTPLLFWLPLAPTPHRSSCCSTASQHTLNAGGRGPRHRSSQGRGAAVCHLPPQLSRRSPRSSLLPALSASSSPGRPGGTRDLRAGQMRSLAKEFSGRVAGRVATKGELPVGLCSACKPWRRADLGRVLRTGACICVGFCEPTVGLP